ncbi:hypothetical protein DIURU_001604 [Diutina rugosa]|uniref:Beta-lactamase-related domain-containing protein n=1 Tax=Diutina rugosa TaxID=5481 RepID=A0A642UT83_DIURU|nr:uncharacterized protein DIURU_001604 [Diutina rugosa]KAA8905176.1 hypothetical protein DIURU_001604 [Diutina rugosa]
MEPRASKKLSRHTKKLVERITSGKSPLINAVVAGVTTTDKTEFIHGHGLRDMNDPSSVVRDDDQFCLYSCTKSMTAMAALILYERGQLRLDVPVNNYLPMIDEIGKIDRGQVNKDDGSFIYPPERPVNKVTVRQLMLHTAGFSYAFLSKDYFRLAQGKFLGDSTVNPTRAFFTTSNIPLLFEPGTQWMYGYNIDWLGLVIEEVSGQRLGEFLHDNVYSKAGMVDTTFHLHDTSRLIKIHKRAPGTKKVTMMNAYQAPRDPPQDMGGQGGFSTVEDYLKFIRIWLNYGTSPDTGANILSRATVEYAIHNHLPPGIRVDFSNIEGVNLPKGLIADGFTLTGNAYNTTNYATGRPKGSIYWSGFANLYYWIDFTNGVGGFWAEQLMPFGDLYSILNYIDFEKSVYEAVKSKAKI